MSDRYPVRKFASAVTFDPGCRIGDMTCATWRQFRDDHPYPTQTFAGKRLTSTRALLIMSEPPPDLTGKEAQTIAFGAFQGLNPVVGTRRWSIGPDGYVEDLVVSFDASGLNSDDLLDSPDLRDRIASLHFAWFGTACGGDVEVIGDGNARVPGSAPVLEVSAKDVGDWMADPEQKWAPIEEPTDTEKTWGDIQLARESGAYMSRDGQLVMLTFGRNTLDDDAKLDALRSAFRRFAVSTDELISAFWSKDGDGQIAFLGRRRTHPHSQIAPLRFETFRMLVREGNDHLAQSYERTSALAGKMLESERDWAPIYLSTALRDTEFGTLLNVTDQMLKGWSEHGNVNYLTFAYPRTPRVFPFRERLSDVVQERTKSSTTLFNWNTKGAAVSVDRRDMTVFVVRNTGSLPIDYGADLPGRVGDPKTGGLRDLEDQAYSYFSGLGDPNLARVVQYTLIYQAVRNLRNDDKNAGTATAQLKPESDALVGEARRLWPTMVKAPSAFSIQLAQFKSAYPAMSDDLIAMLMLDRNEGPGVAQSQGIDLSGEVMSDVAVLAAAFQRTANDKNIDLNAVRRHFEAAAAHDVLGWIKTQSHIVSWAPPHRVMIDGEAAMMISTGGHNLDAVADHFVAGDVSEIGATSARTISVAAEDADKFAAHAAEYSRALRHEEADAARLRSILDRPIPQRSRWQTLGYADAKVETAVSRLGGRVFENDSQFVTALRDIKASTKCCRIMARDSKGNAYIAEANPVPPPMARVTGFGDTSSLGSYMRRFDGKPEDLIVLDQSQASVDSMLSGFGSKASDFDPLRFVRDRYRRMTQRLSGRSDHIFLDDLDGNRDTVAVKGLTGTEVDRTRKLIELRFQQVRVATVEDVPTNQITEIATANGWNIAVDGPPTAIRVRFTPERSGGFQMLDVLIRLGKNKEKLIVRQAVQSVAREGSQIKLMSAVASIRNALANSGDISRIVFVLKRGTTAMQLASARSRRIAA